MVYLVIMPKQGQSVESCIITEIKKKKGDFVKKGDILFSYETDKASFDEEATNDGTVLEVFYEEGDEVPVLEKMMIIGNEGEDYSELIANNISTESIHESKIEQPDITNSITTSVVVDTLKKELEPNDQLFISPRASKLAEKEVLNLEYVIGTGPNGRIIERDIQSHINNQGKLTPLAKKMVLQEKLQPSGKGSGLYGNVRSNDLNPLAKKEKSVDFEDKKISNMRKIIARSMHSSLQNSAQLTHHLGADARCILELRGKVKKALEKGTIATNITLNDMVCFAVIKALKKYPNVNTHFLGETKRYFNKVHLALAVDTDRGLMVPVVRNADDLSIIGLSNKLKEIAEACRKGNIDPDILSSEAGTFTVSNLGNYGVEMFTPVINLPQSGILGVNTIVPRPKDLGNGVYAFVPFIGLSLTYDHRSLDGGEATRFLKEIANEIENLKLDVFL
ncbi:MAG: dihydrolipoamide acetyltransferase family protein [Dysgonamonadaceae bacterium]|mgnify:FL=1|jgi:pyruvate dehydrogenase E2 component (dihydrolipoamide acetyltransferase)|nr:dihydrolipoamide acetyltransferase family protein [Dysgonamonadaceae bacterium]